MHIFFFFLQFFSKFSETTFVICHIGTEVEFLHLIHCQRCWENGLFCVIPESIQHHLPFYKRQITSKVIPGVGLPNPHFPALTEFKSMDFFPTKISFPTDTLLVAFHDYRYFHGMFRWTTFLSSLNPDFHGYIYTESTFT